MTENPPAPPPWLAPHASRISAGTRDALLAEATATLARVHGFRLIPYLVQTQCYFRAITPGVLCDDLDREWDLLSRRQAHRPAGVTRLLEVIIDERALKVQLRRPQIMADQIRHLLALADSSHATIRVIPRNAAFWEQRRHNFDILSFSGTGTPVGVFYDPFLGARIASGDACGIWTLIENNSAADPAESRTILERHLAALG